MRSDASSNPVTASLKLSENVAVFPLLGLAVVGEMASAVGAMRSTVYVSPLVKEAVALLPTASVTLARSSSNSRLRVPSPGTVVTVIA